MRPGGEEDAACAATTCARLGVPFATTRVTVGAGNVQAAARKARYAALRAEAARVGATRIATGHTRTDQAETVLLRLLRGAGARGLAGIPPRRGVIVRPLLERSREEGQAYLEQAGLAWREDPTNGKPSYARNRLRLALWPVVLALAPAAERALARAADLAREDERALAARARAVAGHGSAVDVARLAAEPQAVRRRVIRRLWRNATGNAAGLEAKHVEAVLALSRRRAPGRIALPGGLEARARYGQLELGPAVEARSAFQPVEVPGPGRYVLAATLAVEVDVASGRADEVPWPLALRVRRAGDRFRPDGGRGTKKLKSWLIDRKGPRALRDGLVVLAAGPRVLAVPELGVVAEGFGRSGAGLTVRVHARA